MENFSVKESGGKELERSHVVFVPLQTGILEGCPTPGTHARTEPRKGALRRPQPGGHSVKELVCVLLKCHILDDKEYLRNLPD